MAATQIDGGKQIRSGTITTTQLASAAAITDGQLATSYTKADGTRAFTGDQSMGSHKLTNVTDGSAAADAATYGQMVALLNGLDIKGGARTATDGSETYTIAGGAVTQINGTTIGGVTAAVNDRVLVKNAPSASGVGTADDNNATGTNQAPNGIYAVSAVAANITLARAADADANAEVTANLTITVAEGTFADSIWTLVTNDPITVNTTTLQFTQTDRGTLAFSGGLTKTGKTVKRDDLTGDVTTTSNGNATTIANNAVTNAKMADAAIGIAELSATGTPSGTTFLRGDNTWATPATGLATSNFITRETPSGSVNGSNVTFTLANTPTSGTEQIFLNGILQEPGAGNDYTISSATITYLTAPISGDKIRVSYMK